MSKVISNQHYAHLTCTSDFLSKKTVPFYQNLHSGHSKLSYLISRLSDWYEIWFVASTHDYIGTLYSQKNS